MKYKNLMIFATSLSLLCACSCSKTETPEEEKKTEEKPLLKYEWDKFDIPVKAEVGKEWVLQPQSDEFNYTSTPENKSPEFTSRWTDYYHANWSGPAPTIWQRDHVRVEDGNLRISVSRPEGVEKKSVTSGSQTKLMEGTYTGCITSTKRVKYPAYVEAYAKLSKSTMASDVWMLSPDDTQEIDIIEAYGADRDGGGYGKDRLHLSHHVFVRQPFQDYQPSDAGSWYKSPAGTIWRDDYHRIGVYWKDGTNLEYYVDGKLVRIVNGMNIIDPKGFTGGTGLVKEMDIIINMEDQSWRAIKGLSPTAEELSEGEANDFKVDWIRVYNLE